MRLVIELQCLEHGKLAVRIAGITHLIVGFLCGTRNELFGAKGLELDDIGTGARGGLHQRSSETEPSVVIHTGFRDHRDRAALIVRHAMVPGEPANARALLDSTVGPAGTKVRSHTSLCVPTSQGGYY